MVVSRESWIDSARLQQRGAFPPQYLARKQPLSPSYEAAYEPAPVEFQLTQRARAEEFNKLCRWWRSDTAPLSALADIVIHEGYQQIMAMGEEGLPLILNELKQNPDNPDHWFWALRMIAREDPANQATTRAAAARAWLAWGRTQGYLA